MRFIGIDFSGGARPWRASVRIPTVWIATIAGNSPRLSELIPVQALPGAGSPFDRLVEFLREGDFEAATIDAPFSLPSLHARCQREELIERIRAMPNGPDRPFPMGRDILSLADMDLLLRDRKPLRQTELHWVKKGVATRSTLWNGPRGGAPFTAACLRLIERTDRLCWPWCEFRSGILAEAFPAAQLHQWGLRHKGYSRQEDNGARKAIIAALQSRISIDASKVDLMVTSPDALDAVVAAFGAIAVARGGVVDFSRAPDDGFIAVAA